MPEEIVSRILRLPGYGIYGWDTDEAANTLTLSIRQTAAAPYYICGAAGSRCERSTAGRSDGFGICPGGLGRCGCGWRCIASAVAAVACGPNGCPSSTGRSTTLRGWRWPWPRTVRPLR